MSKLYVGNLSWDTTTDGLREAFSAHGNVTDSICMVDRETGRARGYGFVTYSSSQEADAAIQAMNDTELDGRRIRVNVAGERGGGGGYGGGGGGGYGGGGGGGYGGGGGGGGYANSGSGGW